MDGCNTWVQPSRFTRLVEVCNHLLGRESDEILNAKGKLVGMDRDVTLDRGSTPLTSTRKGSGFTGAFFRFFCVLEPGLAQSLRTQGVLWFASLALFALAHPYGAFRKFHLLKGQNTRQLVFCRQG